MIAPWSRAVWIQSIQGRRLTASTGPVAPSTTMGMRSHQALKIAMAACRSPTLECSASAMMSEPKPGALAPAGVGRSRPATAGSAAGERAVADWDGVMAGVSSRVFGFGRWAWAASNRIAWTFTRRRRSGVTARSGQREITGQAIGRHFKARCCRRRSPMRGLRLFRSAQFLHQGFEATGEALDVEPHRIVVAVADAGVDGGVKRWDKPMSGADTGDGINEREAIVLRGGEARVRRLPVVAAAHARRAAPRLDQFDVQEQPLQSADEIDRALELGLAPRHGEVVVEQHVAGPVDDDMAFAPAVGADIVRQIVDLRAGVDVVGERAAAVVRPAGVVDDEITRSGRQRIIVFGARHRLPQMRGEIHFKILLRQELT